MSLTRDRILDLFAIDDARGRLFWKNPTKYHPRVRGNEAGSARRSSCGKGTYWYVKFDGRHWKRSRLMFLVFEGRQPRGLVDHINGDTLDDRPCNLREATQQENARNHAPYRKRSGLPPGVKRLQSGRFQARLTIGQKTESLGIFQTAEDAWKRYESAKEQAFGSFNRSI